MQTGRAHELPVRVTYADTDRMGVVYYANYFRYFEQGRTELLRSLGARYRDLELRRKLFLPVAEAACRYAAPARYDELLTVRSWVCRLGRASLSFAYEVRAAERGGALLAAGRTRHAVINERWKPAPLPEDLRASLETFVGPEAQV
ncbi:MAG: thioesterase family protein [Elusimicrobia bacterium]|nr:thioesterase family protein [Elusimicrobiota bacterium]